ncbi:MAG TPA: CinA family protein [Burkholderiales bacterium]|nr:CinA family protein [Burkholderiales bacterium]
MRELLPQAERVAALLKQRKQTIAIAESSAGGLISAALLAVPGASAYCRGAAVAYTRHVWLAMRDVDPAELGKIRSATEDWASFQAHAIRDKFGADWGLGETGAAGPTGNRYGDPAGHACFAVAGRGVARAKTLSTGSNDRVANMYAFAAEALDMLVECLEAGA